MLKREHFLYRHIRLDTNEVFYIGIGTVEKKKTNCIIEASRFKRAYDKSKRSNFWKDTVNKINYTVEILKVSDDYNYLKKKEIRLIKLIGRRNLNLGPLVNLTDGGDGSINYKHTKETKKLMSQINLERIARGIKPKSSWKKGMKVAHSVKILNVETGEVFESQRAAAEIEGVNESSFKEGLRNKSKRYLKYKRI